MLKRVTCLTVALTCVACGSTPSLARKVDFDPANGNCRIDGKPFFPIGVWVYGLDGDVMADLHEHRFNTVVGNSLNPKDLPLLQKHGMMCVPMGTDEWVSAAAKDSPSLLGWYLVDEPEGAGVVPEEVKRRYDALKAKDKDHPIGVTHSTIEGPSRYKDACDFNMMDIYPVLRDRSGQLNVVGAWAEAPRKSHGPGWGTFSYIQCFGGPDTDGGTWALPQPHEVRFMAFNALVRRTNGILYFSYWPRAATLWASVADLNKDIERLTPWLLAPGQERTITSSHWAVEARAKQIEGIPGGWMIIATNNQPIPILATLKVDHGPDVQLKTPFAEGRTVRAKSGEWSERFGPYDVKVYLAGPEPGSP